MQVVWDSNSTIKLNRNGRSFSYNLSGNHPVEFIQNNGTTFRVDRTSREVKRGTMHGWTDIRVCGWLDSEIMFVHSIEIPFEEICDSITECRTPVITDEIINRTFRQSQSGLSVSALLPPYDLIRETYRRLRKIHLIFGRGSIVEYGYEMDMGSGDEQKLNLLKSYLWQQRNLVTDAKHLNISEYWTEATVQSVTEIINKQSGTRYNEFVIRGSPLGIAVTLNATKFELDMARNLRSTWKDVSGVKLPVFKWDNGWTAIHETAS